MSVTEATRFSDLSTSPIRPLSQTEVKSVLSDLKDWAKDHAAIARLLGEDGPLKDFIVAAFTLSPYLRDTARIDPRLLARALEEPILPMIGAAIAGARNAWTSWSPVWSTMEKRNCSTLRKPTNPTVSKRPMAHSQRKKESLCPNPDPRHLVSF